jgi:hypothetical protein
MNLPPGGAPPVVADPHPVLLPIATEPVIAPDPTAS